MDVIAKTNDPITLSAYQVVLRQAGIESWVLDHHTSVLEGSLGVLPRRLMVDDGDTAQARRILADYERDLTDGRLESMDEAAEDWESDHHGG
jgi:hypothetical protein